MTLLQETDTSVAKQHPVRVGYLLGAGATQGCISYAGSSRSLLMTGLAQELNDRMHQLVGDQYKDRPAIRRLVNDAIDSSMNFEQLITFLEDVGIEAYRKLARELRSIFANVLRAELEGVSRELGPERSFLYQAMVDMHSVEAIGEELAGFLTLNYDVLLDHAIELMGLRVDNGVSVGAQAELDERLSVPVLKLHGSFGWEDDRPIEPASSHAGELWIPPGIRKTKTDYPFNAIWGRAHELLDCDILRVVGCNLGANDWDLVSLIFRTMHTNASRAPYVIEVISWLHDSERVRGQFPYLNVRSLVDLPKIGKDLTVEVFGEERRSDVLTEEDRRVIDQKIGSNPFERWLRLKGETVIANGDAITTSAQVFESLVEGNRAAI